MPLVWQWPFWCNTKGTPLKERIDKLGLIKTKNLCSAKDTVKKIGPLVSSGVQLCLPFILGAQNHHVGVFCCSRYENTEREGDGVDYWAVKFWVRCCIIIQTQLKLTVCYQWQVTSRHSDTKRPRTFSHPSVGMESCILIWTGGVLPQRLSLCPSIHAPLWPLWSVQT